MKSNQELLKRELNTLSTYLHRCKINERTVNENDTYYSLLKLLDDKSIMDKPFLYEKEIYRKIYSHGFKDYDKTIKFIKDNKEIYTMLEQNTGYVIENSGFLDNAFFGFFKDFKTYNENDIKDIILSYFNSIRNIDYKYAKKMFDEGRIFNNADDLFDGFGGMELFSNYLKSSYIYIDRNKYDTLFMTYLAHELGHTIDTYKFIFSNNITARSSTYFFEEFPSTFYEIGFLKYIYDNNIDKTGSLILKMSIFSKMYDYCNSINDMYNFDTSDLTKREEDSIIFDTSFVYRYLIGYYLSLLLWQIYTNDKKESLRIFDNISFSRKNQNIIELLKSFNMDIDYILSADFLENEIKENIYLLKMRYYNK